MTSVAVQVERPARAGRGGCARRRVLVLLAGAGALLAGPAGPPAAARTTGVDARAAAEQEVRALALLSGAAQAARSRSWWGTQHVTAVVGGVTTSGLLEVRHAAGEATRVQQAGGTGEAVVVPGGALDGELLQLLAARYELSVAGPGRCAGRDGHVVQARRPGGAVAARLWVDGATGLVLRREVFDAGGRLLRTSAYVDLAVDAVPTGLSTGGPDAPPSALPDAELQALGAPARLPGGYVLFEGRRPRPRRGPVLQLAYSDGLSTVSLFRQPGALGPGVPAGWSTADVDGTRVLVGGGSPGRLVWQAGTEVLVLVGDAPREDLLAAVAVLPHHAPGDGLPDRFGRGLARVGSWLDPTA